MAEWELQYLDKQREKLEQGKRHLKEVEANSHAYWKTLAGGLYQEMLASASSAMACATHADPKVRYVAISMLNSHWRHTSDEAYARLCENAAIADADAGVRIAALSGLAACYRGTDNVRVGKLLAGVVHRDAESVLVRWTAYRGLFAVRGRKTPSKEVSAVKARDKSCFLDDVDWAFVETFQADNRVSSPAEPIEMQLCSVPDESREFFRASVRGKEAYRRGDFSGAVLHLTRAIEIIPPAPAAILFRASAYLHLGQLDAAIADFTRMISLCPNSADAYYGRSEAYKRKGAYEAAREDHETCMRLRQSG
jgi:tetratricopeptide (TPR) repeat protein